jgi:glutathione S-transferase
MVTLYQFPRQFGLPSASPFCVKVETWLRMAGIPYENAWVTNPAGMPKGKCPAIAHGGHTIGDSTFILAYLEERFAPGLDDALDTRARAVAHAFSRMLEERSYWALVYSRWVDHAGWASTREMFFGHLPPGIRGLVATIARRQIRGQLHGHGIGRHTADEIYALGVSDVGAVSDWLGDKPFFMGDAPTAVDATVYGFVANALHSLDGPLARAARLRVNLAPYCERMRARFFPELEAKS